MGSIVRWVPILALLGCVSAPAPGPGGSASATDDANRETVSARPLQVASLPGVQAARNVINDDAFNPELTRDPFASPAPPPPTPPADRDPRPRKSRHFTIAELKLVGTVTETDTPRAMLVDPRGKGWVVTRGEIIGRAELVNHIPRSWRVDRIREGDVVLRREDPLHEAAPETRVLAMRDNTPQLNEEEDD